MRGLAANLVLLALLMTVVPAAAEAPPVEFGLEEFRRALQETGTKLKIRTEISTAAPETYRITTYRIQGGDLRGLMYGLFAAADQIRTRGRLVPERGRPAIRIRGVRRFLHNQELESTWYHSRDYWRDYIRMLARNRFNRLNLVFAHQTAYLAPPYPYWVEVDEFPEIRVPGLSAEQRQQNLETLCYIAQTASDHAVDFTLGVWQHDSQKGRQTPAVAGITADNVGPYSYQALKKVLAACPAIRSLQIRTNWESGIPKDKQVEFYREYVYKALAEAGRLVTLDLRGWLMGEGMLRAAEEAGIPWRLSSKYWAEHLGRPYQPAETFRNYSYIDFLRRTAGLRNGRVRPYDFFWELWGLGSHRLLLWGDPEYVKRVASTLTISGSDGFEIDEPLAQKGYGNRPGQWGIFSEAAADRKFWNWEFERYWLFYRLWGRIAYDPKTSDRAWTDEFAKRFGEAGPAVLEAYRQASGVLNEIVTVHMPDPNMYMWPEINPGGLIDYYAAAPPSDRRLVASIEEAVRARVDAVATAKQSPAETSGKFENMAASIRASLEAADAAIGEERQEWNGTRPDFEVLAYLAEFHQHRQIAAEQLTHFYQTGDRAALEIARFKLQQSVEIWEKLAAFTDGLYPPQMAFGPEDTGHWKDKLPYLRHDLKTIEERAWLLERFGQFQFGFDFGGAPGRLAYRQLIHSSVEPRFVAVSPESSYDAEAGFGWIGEGVRDANVLPDASKTKVRATASNPKNLPENALFGDSIRGTGAQTFRVRTGPGDYGVSLLSPDGNVRSQLQQASNGVVDIVLPEHDWELSGVIIKNVEPATAPARPAGIKQERPAFSHLPPRRLRPGSPLNISLRVTPSAGKTVRMHYRPMNALEKFRTLEAPGGSAVFAIPGEEITAEFDLLYYFEILSEIGQGWFYPNPAENTPYYVIEHSPPATPRRR